ncbi:MAG: DMT family transporter [Actinobacteria bacterium]|nr:DMT family transporter [Actinomycetota bacterium]MBU1944845.1 DMT family transporter [Actinomycetota bacterium]MBU2687088.1 DMT family transporter [Actinomycetota bacterium]
MDEVEEPVSWLPYALICVAPVVWGMSGVLVHWTGLAGHEQVLVFWRSVFASAFFVALILAVRKPALFRPSGQPLLLVASGLATAAFTICAFKAYNTVSIGTATFIMYLSPVFVALLAPVFLAERLEGTTLVCLAIALAGTGLLAWGQSGGSGDSALAGSLLAFGSAVFWAMLMITWKRLLEQGASPITVGLYTNGVCALVYAAFGIPGAATVSGKGWAVLAVFGVVSIGAAGLSYIYALRRVKAQDAAILSYIEPVSATVFGAIFLGQAPHWQDYCGAALIIAAGLLLLRMKSASRIEAVIDPGER